MYRSLHRTLLGAALAAALGLAAPVSEAALPFTYQGLLEQSGTPFDGNVNLEFRLYDAPSGGVQHGNTVTLNAWPVSRGLLNADLDFGNAVVIPSAISRWIEVRVNGTALMPRQTVMPAPLADSAQSLVGRGVANIAPASGQVLTWMGSSWMPQTPTAGASYNAGIGLTLTGNTFAANFGASGVADTVARSDHHHGAAAWTNSAATHTLSLVQNTAATGYAALSALHLGNTAGSAFGVVGTATASANGVGVSGTGARFGVEGIATGASSVGVRGEGNVGGVLGEGGLFGVRGVRSAAQPSGVAVEAYADATSGDAHAMYAQNASSAGTAVGARAAATSGSPLAGLFQVDSPNGVALRGVVNPSSAGTAVAVDAVTHHQGGAAVRARVNHASSAGHAVDAATAGSGSALRAESTATGGATRSVLALNASPDGTAVLAENTATSGVARAGRFVANAPAATALEALAGGGGNAWGLYARSDGSNGAAVEAYAAGSTGRGVRATAMGGSGVAIEGTANGASARAGQFNGHVHVTGTLSKGGGSFKIDHPLDPENQYLYHSFVESPDMLNIYNGNVTTDAQGRATVQLPDWFGALNRDFRYQLTVIGSFARAMVAEEVDDNRFTIRTDEPNTKVSWLVTGVRQDAWAQANRIPVEQAKPADEKGTLLHPEARGEPASKGLQAHRAAAAKASE